MKKKLSLTIKKEILETSLLLDEERPHRQSGSVEEGIEYSIEELEAVFEDDFESACNSAELVADNSDINLDEHPECVKEVLIEMVFQLGVGGVSKFKKFLANLSTKTYHLAADEMLDSRWAKQTPMRAENLSYIIRQLAH